MNTHAQDPRNECESPVYRALLDACVYALAALEDDTRSPRRLETVKAGLRAAIAKATG